MLVTRLITAFFGILLFIIIMLAPSICLVIALTIIAMICLFELFNAFKLANLKPVDWIGYISVMLILFSNEQGWISDFRINYFLTFLVILGLFFHVVFSKNEVTIVDISVTFFAIFYISFLLSFIVFTRNMENGNLFVLFIFIGAWATDSLAYFSGRFLGKNKLIPDISPKKTIEGCAGGVLGGLLGTLILGLIINSYYDININLVHYAILGILISIAAQIGDLSASAIKRTTKIKDFGDIMPGHGGMIDRFDSVLFVAPVVYFYFNIIL